MPKLEYFLVSESLSVDQETNLVSIFRILEEWSGKLPVILPHLVATSSWLMEPDEKEKDFQATLRVRTHTGEVLPEPGDFNINFTTERDRHRIFHHIHNLRIEDPGPLVFEISLNGKRQASHTATIRRIEQES